jgi:hypothetical protein
MKLIMMGNARHSHGHFSALGDPAQLCRFLPSGCGTVRLGVFVFYSPNISDVDYLVHVLSKK